MNELNGKRLDRLLLNAFAHDHKEKGRCIDLGCGPGQTTAYLFEQGMHQVVGTDISPVMIETAKKHHPHITFETADMLSLPYNDHGFASALAFYSIVHFTYKQVAAAFAEIARILIPGSAFLFSFHTGEKTVHLDEFLGHEVNIDFYFFDTDKILALLAAAGFEPLEVIERRPYAGAEHPSTRAYILAKA